MLGKAESVGSVKFAFTLPQISSAVLQKLLTSQGGVERVIIIFDTTELAQSLSLLTISFSI